jgi:hypothetical protein
LNSELIEIVSGTISLHQVVEKKNNGEKVQLETEPAGRGHRRHSGVRQLQVRFYVYLFRHPGGIRSRDP